MPSLRKPVFFDNDGSIDDFIALILLLHFKDYRVSGISLIDGAGEFETSLDICLRILKKVGLTNIKVAKSNAVPVNQFPEKWRKMPAKMLELECLKDIEPDYTMLSSSEGADFLAQTLLAEEEKTVILATAPATNLVTALDKYPELANKIEKLIWMGGAFKHDGNVLVPDHDGSAEWNVFWDPVAAQKLIRYGLPMVMVTVDACSLVPANSFFMYQLENCKGSDACQIVHKILEYPYSTHETFYLHDVVAAAYLGCPEMAKLDETTIEIEQRGTSIGNIYQTENGSNVTYICDLDDEMFYEFIQKSIL